MNNNLNQYITLLINLSNTLKKIGDFISKSLNDNYSNDFIQQLNTFFISCGIEIKNDIIYQLILTLLAEKKPSNVKYLEYLFLTYMSQYNNKLMELNKLFCKK